MTLFLILFFVLLLLPDLYIWFFYVHAQVPALWSAAYWLPTIAAVAALGAFAMGHYSDMLMKLFFALLLCVALPKMCFALLSIAGRGFGLFLPHAATVGNLVGIGLAIIACGAFAYGLTSGWKRLVVREQTLSFASLPAAFDGYRIVQFSDLHAGTFGSDTTFVHELVARINALQPDMVVFTGDAVNSSAEELEPQFSTLARLSAPDGVYSVLGNHDYCEYRRYDTPDGAERNLETLKQHERALGWQLLLNEHRIVRRGADSIALIGVENDGRPPFPSRGNLQQALAGVDKDVFKVLLSHDPTHWRREVLPSTDIALTLSGHTHAMQLQIFGFSPSAWSYSEWGGIYHEGNRLLHVSLGVGGTLPFRLGAWPEINLLTLRRTDSD